MNATWALAVFLAAPAERAAECGRNTELRILVVLWLREERESVIADSTVTLMLLLRLVDAVHLVGCWTGGGLLFSFCADWVASRRRFRNDRSAPFTRSESTAISAICSLALSA